ncbi:DUF29 family protein [Spirulina subsalsa]|uniref:DUF29 domain-containing protein n=1 Tax=Spirulina subsalsa TaxID=54311 RepID=UPI000315494D
MGNSATFLLKGAVVIGENLYERDFYSWSCQQAELLRDRKFDQVDWSNVIEEIEDLGRSEYRALVSALEQLTLHLLKWQYQPQYRSPSWRHSIDKQRIKIERILEDNPGLVSRREEVVAKGYKYGRKGASKETFLEENVFPDVCPYVWEELLDEQFFPELF